MASGTLPTWLRGLIIPDPRFTFGNFDQTNSAYTEGGPRPGDAAMIDESDLVLEGSGSILATTDIYGKTIYGGNAGTSRFVWRRNGDTNWRGWCPYVNLSGFRFIERSTTADKWHPRHQAVTSDGTVLMVSVKDLRQIVCHVIDPATGAPTEVEVFDPGSAASLDTQPCLLVLPGGRVLCFYWREASSLVDVRMSYSDDNGATWLPGQKGCLPLADVVFFDLVSSAPGRLRAYYHKGQVGLIAQIQDTATPEDQLWQYASNDLGANFTRIDILTGVSRAYPDVVVRDGKIFVAYVASGAAGYAATYLPYYRVITSAYQPLSNVGARIVSTTTDTMEWGTAAGGVFTAGEMSLWLDDNGDLYMAGVDHDTAGGAFREVMVRKSGDAGANWTTYNFGLPGFAADGLAAYAANDASTYLLNICGMAHGGRSWLLSRHVASAGTGDDSVSIAYLGGYTTVEPAQANGLRSEQDWITGYVHTYLPLDLPDATGGVWTLSTAGAPTASLTALGLRLQSGAGESIVYSTGTLTGTLAEGIEIIAECRVDSGTARCNLRISDATPLEYEVVAQVSTTAITLYDNKAPGNVATVATSIANGSHVQVKVNIRTASATMWYRSVGTHHAQHDQDWILVGTTAALSSAAANTGSKVIFGQDASSDTYWRLLAYTHDSYAGIGVIGQDNFGDLVGRPYSALPVYLADGCKVQAVSGPTYRNEDWRMRPRFDHPVSNVHTASPREPWRSADDATQVDLEWDLGGATWPMGSMMGIYLGGCNFGFCTLFGKDSGGTWQNLGNLDMRIQTGLKFTRADRIVRPDASGGSSCPDYFPADILAGSYVSLPPAEGETAVVRKIQHNNGGVWVQGGASQDVRILLESVDGTEATAGVSAQIWSKDGAFLVPITQTYSAFRIRIPVQATFEGYFQVGTASLGHFHAFAKEPSRGRALEIAPIYELTEARSAIRRARRNAPGRRAVDLNWTDALDSSNGTVTNPDPNYTFGWGGGGLTSSVGVRPMALYDLKGQIERLGGAETACTYIAASAPPVNSTTIKAITNRSILLHGRVMTETWRMDHVLGNEWTRPGEVHRGSTLRIEEEV